MSRLDSAIRRLQAQRECLDCAAKRIASKPGIVLEIGLGNGRTYDHLRSRLPGREIYVFDRQAAPHPFCLPEEQYLVLGDLYATLPEFLGRRAGQVVLVHCDIGSGQPAITDPLAAFLAESLGTALTTGALVVSDQPLKAENLRSLELPAGIAGERYFMYKKSEVIGDRSSVISCRRRYCGQVQRLPKTVYPITFFPSCASSSSW